MQYKGFKMMKRAAAVIVSAAIMLADIQGVSAAGTEQTVTAETMEAETLDASAQTGTDEGLPVEDFDAEQQTDVPDETIQESADEAETAEIAETETTQVETDEKEEQGSERDSEEETQTEMPQTKTEESEQIVSEEASEIPASQEDVADTKIKEITFWNYEDESKTPITQIAVSVNDPVTVVADFGDNTVPSGAKVQWGTNEVTPNYVKLTSANTVGVMNAIKIEGLKPTKSGETIRVTCYVSDSDGEPIFGGDFSVKVNPLAEKVSIKIGNSTEDTTGKEVIYSYDMEKGDNRFIAVGGVLLSEADQKADGFTASVYPVDANQEVTWKSSNTSIIKFSDKEEDKHSGKITVSGVGEVTITATSTDGSNVIGSVRIKVRRLIKDLSFEVKPADKNSEKYEYTKESYEKGERIPIAAGTSISITPKTTPADATVQRISWSRVNGNDSALDMTVNDTTNVLTVTAKSGASGQATLRAKTTDMSEIERDLRFEIMPKVESLKIFATDSAGKETEVTNKSIGYDPTTYDSKNPNNTYVFKAEALPNGASQKVTWKISNSKIATVEETADNQYKVEVNPEMTGTAVITATTTDGSSFSASTTLRVASLAQSVKISGSKVVMKGKTIKLTASVFPKSVGNVKFKWESYDPAIATVNAMTGEVTGKALGYAKIVATAQDGSEQKCDHIVRVTDPPKEFDIIKTSDNSVVTGKTVGLDPDVKSLDKETLEIKILPNTASQTVEWKSSNEKIVTCTEVENSNGKQVVIEAKALGTATLTAKSLDGSGKTASIKVNVNTLVSDVTITGGHYVAKDKTLQLKAEIKNADAANRSILWKSDAPKIAEVDEHGLVTAVGKDGMARITAEAADGSGAKDTYYVYVVSKSNKVEIYSANSGNHSIRNNTLEFGTDTDIDTVNLGVTLSGGYTQRDGYPIEMKWSTSSKDIATVEPNEADSSLAKVTIYKKGTVKITATTMDGFETSSTVTIKVKDVKPQVKITGPAKRLARGKKMKLSVGSVQVEWESDSPDLAKVNSKGQVTADKFAEGTVRIAARAVNGGSTDYYDLVIGDPVENIGLTLNGTLIEEPKKKIGVDIINGCANNKRYEGNGIKLGANLDYADGTSEENSANVTWTSSNKGVAVIDKDGNVELKKKGNVTFTATAADGSRKKAKVTFVVSKQMTQMYPVGCNPGDTKEIHVGLKKSISLSTQIAYKPLAATKPKLVWEIADESDAVKIGKNNGKVTGRIEGDFALIKATDANNENVCCYFKVFVENPVNKVEIIKKADAAGQYNYQSVIGIDLSENDEKSLPLAANLYAKYDEDGAPTLGAGVTTDVIWSSSNKAVASVDGNGVVTAHKNGEVTITATATDGSKKKGKVKVCCGNLVKEIVISDSIKGGIDLDLGKKSQKTFNLADKLKVMPVTATYGKLNYVSEDKTVAVVNSKGKITAKGEGSTNIIVTSKDGGCSIPISVYVYDSRGE